MSRDFPAAVAGSAAAILRAVPRRKAESRRPGEGHEGIGKNPPADSLSRNGSSYGAALGSASVFYLNVVITSDNADAVAKNKGQWCIKGDALLGSLTYHGTLSGNDLELEVPQPNGKIKKMSFAVYDHKWRKLADI